MKRTILIILLSLCTAGIQSYAQTIKPYHEVISPKAITKKGFLQVHQLDKILYLEISSAMLNKAMLFVKHDSHSEYKQIKWIKKEGRIHLFIPEIESQVGNIFPSDTKYYIKKITPATFPILAVGQKDSSYVIDVTSLFLNPPKELVYRREDGAIVGDLAFIEKILAIDNTIEVSTTKIITSKNGPITVDTDFSLSMLPEHPMMPRLFDHRIGFFNDKEGVDILGRDMESRQAITRWRLEKRDKDQQLSDPIKPITLYFDPATPNKWKPYIKAGVEQWLPAFEAAGFKNAIVVKEPPIHDKNFSVNSMRYSFIRWSDKTHYRGKERGSSASVSRIIDHRSGEILKGNILLGAPYGYLSDEYFVRCAPLDARAQQHPFPDDLMGELIECVTAHEAGHLFGLIDGHYGEYTYPFDKMRDKHWLETMGHTPSVMNYARQNFIVQPEDNIPLHLLRQKVGPTDLYNIRWGYTPFNGANTPDEELPYLENIVREQDTIPWYRFNSSGSGNYYGPQQTNEVVETDNPIKATTLGLKNLKRVIQLIPSATRNERGDEIKDDLYQAALKFWGDQMESVVSLVGSYTIHNKSGSQGGSVFTPIPAQRQKEAVVFLIENAFQPPLWLVPESLTDRINQYGQKKYNPIETLSSRQIKILHYLLSSGRLKNFTVIIDQGTNNVYALTDLVLDLNEGLWSELNARNVTINACRQEIQMAYIGILKKVIESEDPNNYTRGVMYQALKNLKNTIEEALKNTNDMATKGHLELCLLEIEKV